MKTITAGAASWRNPPDAVKPALGRHLRSRRESLGITTEQMILASGLRRWQLFRVEQGARPIPRDWFEQAAAALNRLERMQRSGLPGSKGAGE